MALQQINWLQINTENIPSGSQVILASESNPLEWVYTKNLFTSGGFIVSGSLDTSGDVVIGGNLTVKGATTIIESNIVSIGDRVIELNGTLGSYGGLIVKDPTQPNTISGSLLWDTLNDKWIGGPLGSEEGFIQETEFNNYTSSVNTLINSIVSGFSTNGFIQGGNSFGSTAIIGTNDNQSLILETNGSTRMFVSSSGDIGIGTTSPTEKLEVDGKVKATSFIKSGGKPEEFLKADGSTSTLPFLETTEDIVAATTVGGINAGETIEAGTDIQEFVKQLLDKTYYPKYREPVHSLTSNAGDDPKEVGSSFDITLTFNFDRGQILGTWVGNIWKETAKQADRLGAATSYILNGVNTTPDNFVTMTVTVSEGTNTLSGTTYYGVGPQPKDSKGDPYGDRVLSGSTTQSTTFKGVYPYFYYKSTSQISPESMKNAIANGQATKVIKDSTGTIKIPFNANGEYIAVAYPATSTTKTKWYVDDTDKGDIEAGGGVFGLETTLLCSDSSTPKLWEDVYYKIHVSPGLITQDKEIQLRNS